MFTWEKMNNSIDTAGVRFSLTPPLWYAPGGLIITHLSLWYALGGLIITINAL